ncbi:MAG: ribonuclease III [Deltaproteobacteria bacterium]|nr:ribonuclease III [Deltaproteobacteria bacterium]
MPVDNLDMALNCAPPGFRPGPGARVHLIGVGGVAMASLAGLLAGAGCRVTGSDLDVYPPASCMLGSIGLVPLRGYGPGTLEGAPDLVVVGNVVTRAFPVLEELDRLKLHFLSLPQVLEQFFLDKTTNIVVAGCHGKTSLTNLVAVLLDRACLPSGHFIGGASADFPVPWRAAPPGGLMVVEGDEYDCAFFDKNPKFLHYRPKIVVLTSVEYDHADIYPDHESVRGAYLRLMALLPPDGLLVYFGDDPDVEAVASAARCRRLSYGTSPDRGLFLSEFKPGGLSTSFTLGGPGLFLLREVARAVGDDAGSFSPCGEKDGRPQRPSPEKRARRLPSFPGGGYQSRLRELTEALSQPDGQAGAPPAGPGPAAAASPAAVGDGLGPLPEPPAGLVRESPSKRRRRRRRAVGRGVGDGSDEAPGDLTDDPADDSFDDAPGPDEARADGDGDGSGNGSGAPAPGPGCPAAPSRAGVFSRAPRSSSSSDDDCSPLSLMLPKPGLHNALNAAAAAACFLAVGGGRDEAAPILAQVRGVRRRQQVLLDRDGITLIDDFAHHPTAVAATLRALRDGFPSRRIIAAFEPRSNTSRRALFQKDYVRSLKLANVVFLSGVDNPGKAPEGDRLDVARLARDVGQAAALPDPRALAKAVLAEVKSGDVVVLMSNGGFGGVAKILSRDLESQLDDGRFSDSWLCGCGCNQPCDSLALAPRTDYRRDEVAGYRFQNPALLESALTHRSVLGSAKCCQPKDGQCREGADGRAGAGPPPRGETEKDNQRLEFLGDSVLNLFVAELLFRGEPKSNEGEMTRQRACLVCESRLAEVARGLDLGFRLTMAPGEESSGGRERPSVLADAMEAVLGAVYLDGGHRGAMDLVEKLWGAYIDGSFPKIVDHKSRLQEVTQRLKLGQPAYTLVGVSGPSHSQTFTMRVVIGDMRSSATGSTKKMAGQRAARELFQLLVQEYPDVLE